jgi:hypothetical protein
MRAIVAYLRQTSTVAAEIVAGAVSCAVNGLVAGSCPATTWEIRAALFSVVILERILRLPRARN